MAEQRIEEEKGAGPRKIKAVSLRLTAEQEEVTAISLHLTAEQQIE
ncbi:hypothetical protein [Ectobacillus sp. sgz5001026]